MKTAYRGNCITISFAANELTTNRVIVQLPDGYSYESIRVLNSYNITEILPYFKFTSNIIYRFPPVGSYSPCTFSLLVENLSIPAEVRILIEKFGQIPDTHYFDAAFKPILVTGNDGNKYNVIPSDQFK